MYHLHFCEICRLNLFFIIENIAELILPRIAHAILSFFIFFFLLYIHCLFFLVILVALSCFSSHSNLFRVPHTQTKLMTMTSIGMKWLVFSSILSINSTWQQFFVLELLRRDQLRLTMSVQHPGLYHLGSDMNYQARMLYNHL